MSYPGLTSELLAALRVPGKPLPGEHAVYERVAEWVNVDGSAVDVRTDTPGQKREADRG